nr:hypothetical protein KPHV_29960 [Kitasatospora purpeofusca]
MRLLVRPGLQPLPVQQPVSAQVGRDQEYEACHPLDGQRRIRIVSVAGNRADVETLGPGPARPRSILLNSLHPTATTADGRPRRTGYRLLDPAERSPK